MQSLFTLVLPLSIFSNIHGQTVTGIAAEYHDGQIFITWNNIPAADTGFYYIYKNSIPITSANIQNSTYIGRALYNSSYDFRLTFSMRATEDPQYFTINDYPAEPLTEAQGFFVMNCTEQNATDYFAVRCGYGYTSPNWTVLPGANSTIIPTIEHLDPIKAYWQKHLSVGDGSDTMDVFVHYGSEVAVGEYPAMANEGGLAFHFGITKNGVPGGNNSLFCKFHGGNGDFITSGLSTDIPNSWCISFDDWIPGFNYEDEGANTRWIGYIENLDIYSFNKNSSPPRKGTIKAYTFYRIKWETEWVKKNWGAGTIDTNKVYLTGSSLGGGGVLIHSVVDPLLYASCSATDGKFNMAAPDDSNPYCKFNEGNSGRKNSRVIWGNEDSVNLFTDIHYPGKPNKFYKIYDLTNMNFMFDKNANTSLPFLYSVSGKNDDNTCWEEKVDVYSTVQSTRMGGIFLWDLRGHNGGATEWKPAKLSDLARFSINTSYPAFSNCMLDGDPGSDVNPSPPYYSGDDIGSLHANLDWDDASLKDSVNLWELEIYMKQDSLDNDSVIPALLPSYATTDLAIRRAQLFKNFPSGTVLYWINIHNGDTVQSKTTTQKYKGTVPKPVVLKKVKVYEDGSIVRVQTSPFGKTFVQRELLISSASIFPNPASNNLNLRFDLADEGNVGIFITNILGKVVWHQEFTEITQGRHEFVLKADDVPPGIYLVTLASGDEKYSLRLVKE